MESLIGKTLEELKSIVSDYGLPSFTAKQISQWIYAKRCGDINAFSNLSQKNRQILSEQYQVGLTKPIGSAHSKDGTIKYLFQTENGPVETVFIPEEERATLCVSCQVGCKMNCSFCMTGRMGFHGSLSSTEILNQILSIPESERLTNIVFMGMGEPMDNIDEVLRSVEILTSDYGLAWSPKRITVSTVGLIPGLRRLLDESQCHVAVSLHNPIAEERLELMPVQKAYPITDVIALLRQYDFSHQRRISFEYTLFAGMNDTSRHASALLRLLRGLECRINLIRFHAIPDSALRPTDLRSMERFRDYLNDNGLITTIRRSRGQDIEAACGLLSTKERERLSGKDAIL
ncbi:MAG: 23S rRNA (adenine(2503)-C(2))-methyltransferase RlmN [Paludibacteraceae bacterium]|nr:23S rRNA (adenine(2503)-C(2))-methyltransferase RlmN [Paludibacteraceae bacterium]